MALNGIKEGERASNRRRESEDRALEVAWGQCEMEEGRERPGHLLTLIEGVNDEVSSPQAVPWKAPHGENHALKYSNHFYAYLGNNAL